MTNIESRLLNINKYLFISGFILLSILVMFSSLYIVELSGIDLPERKVEEKTIWFFVGALLLAPIIETYLFQKLPIDFFRDSFKKDWPLV